MTSTEDRIRHRRVAYAILSLVVLFALALITDVAPTSSSSPSPEPDSSQHAAAEIVEHSEPEVSDAGAAGPAIQDETLHADRAEGDGEHVGAAAPPESFVAPFALLLGAIAIFPLWSVTEHWWESNLHRFLFSVAASLCTLWLYWTWQGGWPSVMHVLEHALVDEYIPFIVLLFSLYTISGGIRIQGDLPASPRTNTLFIAAGGLLASFIGTTGAAMLLIRPLLETNQERKYVQHTVVFFIFVVCNCGGCLLPIGDPPLFLGYLEGVSFLWTLWYLWAPWLFVNVVLCVFYWLVDRLRYYPHESARDLRADQTQTRPLRIRGLHPNAWLLLGVVLCVALLDPNKPFPGTDWHAYPHLREVVQLSLVALSLLWGDAAARDDNRFDYHAIVEVAALFVGIFICMQPALEILNERGTSLGMDTPVKLYAITGALSSVLDNAPTYLVFFRTAAAQFNGVESFAQLVSQDSEQARMAREMLIGISLGAVFMGSMTYIGNGPNFMVRAIAEQSGVRMPSFFGFTLRYSLPLLLPILIVTAWLFL